MSCLETPSISYIGTTISLKVHFSVYVLRFFFGCCIGFLVSIFPLTRILRNRSFNKFPSGFKSRSESCSSSGSTSSRGGSGSLSHVSTIAFKNAMRAWETYASFPNFLRRRTLSSTTSWTSPVLPTNLITSLFASSFAALTISASLLSCFSFSLSFFSQFSLLSASFLLLILFLSAGVFLSDRFLFNHSAPS